MGKIDRLVSIVVPCHNAEDWIGDTIRSALSQTDVETELILVDDGSVDRSVERARAVAGERLRVLRQARGGASRARNAGTAAAAGPFIQYLDADDVLYSGTLRKRLDALTVTGSDVAYCNWVRLEPQEGGGYREGDPIHRVLGPRPDVELLDDAWWPPGAVLYRRSLIDKILPWRVDLPVIQDARFLLDAALAGARFAHANHVGLEYRVRHDSLSRHDQRAFLEDCFRSGAELHERWGLEGTLDPQRRRALLRLYGYLARSFFVVDRARLADVLQHARRLDKHFVPPEPRSLRVVSRIVGYPAAEHVASAWRRLKRLAPPEPGRRPSQPRI
jgi:glycosyltransferase involved in cell wall biosynthesis